MLSIQQLRDFGRDGYIVVPALIDETVLTELDEEVDALIARKPPPADKVGFHHYFEHPTQLPVADSAWRDTPVQSLAEELVAPLAIDLAFDHIQIATSIYGWSHEPGGGHIDGYGTPGQRDPDSFTMLAAIYLGDETKPGRGNLWVWPGSHLVHERLFQERGVDILMSEASMGGHACMLTPSPNFGAGQPVLARRGDVLLAHHLLAHNQSGNMWNEMRRIIYYRLAVEGHRERWADTQTNALLEYAPVQASL